MQAIEHTMRAIGATSVDELQREINNAKQALTDLEAAKLEDLAAEVREAQSRIGYAQEVGAREIPRERRAIRDNPQA